MDRGRLIREKRKERGITQEQLAKKCGLSTITIRQYESGKRIPALESLIQIANALCVPFDSLIDAQGKEAPMYKAIMNAHDTLVLYSHGQMTETQFQDVVVSERRAHIQKAFDSLNDEGQRVAVERVNELAEIPKYQRTDTAKPSARPSEENHPPTQENPSVGLIADPESETNHD